ncbi:MAG: response regulator [Pirellulaceae bacterium]
MNLEEPSPRHPSPPVNRTEYEMPIEETFAFQLLKALLPVGTFCCSVASVVVYFAYGQTTPMLGVYLLTIAVSYELMRRHWVPRIRTRSQSDVLALVVFGGALGADFVSAWVHAAGSPLNTALLLALGSFAFASNIAFALLVGIGISGQLLCRIHLGLPIDIACIHLAILAPVYAILLRFSAQYLQRRVLTASLALRENIRELETEKRRRQESEKQLVHAQKMEGLGLLAAGVAHDFNNHLQAIGTLAELIKRSPNQDDIPDQIIRSSQRAADICRRMLTYAGKTLDERDDIDLISLVLESEPILGAGIPKPIELQFHSKIQSAIVHGNRSALQQCVTNLVNNAVDAVDPRRGKIDVSVDRDSNSEPQWNAWRVFGERLPNSDLVFLEVRDNGCGMDSKTLECAFDPYFTTKRDGHGFGLATTLGIVRSFGGAIRCETAVGQGTRMQMVFPLMKPTEAMGQSSSNGMRNMNVQNVLLVDDEAIVRNAMARLLTANGWRVSCAASGDEALRVLRSSSSPFDLLLLDYAMPEMTGLDLLQAIRAEGHPGQAILCSGFAEDAMIQTEAVRPDAFLTKPYRFEDLIDVLKN